MNKSIVITLVLLVGLGLIYFLGGDYYKSTVPDETTEGFQKIQAVDYDKVTRIVLEKGDAEPVELEKTQNGWVVASSYGYTADQEKIEEILDELDAIEGGEVAGQAAASHENFGVDEQQGGFIRVYKAEDLLGEVVIGKRVPTAGFNVRDSSVFLRAGGEDTTYRVESDIRSKANIYNELDSSRYLQKLVFEIGEGQEVRSVRLVRPGAEDILVERRRRVKEPEDEGESEDSGDPATSGAEDAGEDEPETEEYFVVTSGAETVEVNEEKWKARGLLDRGKRIRIDDVADPAGEGYGLDEPQLEAVVTYAAKEDEDTAPKTFSLRFGNAKKSAEGEDSSYYLAVDDVGHDGDVFLVESFDFDGWNKKLEDFLPTPEPEEEEGEAPGDGAAGAGEGTAAGSGEGTGEAAGSPGDAAGPAPEDEGSAAEAGGEAAGTAGSTTADDPEGDSSEENAEAGASGETAAGGDASDSGAGGTEGASRDGG